MGFAELLIISMGLAMDSVTVALSCGLLLASYHHAHALRIALYMGFFQGALAALGWLVGSSFQQRMEQVDHWVAFAILLFLGLRMVYHQFSGKGGGKCFDPTNHRVLAGLGLATSIDALAVGVTLGLVSISILYAAITIGMVSLGLSFLAVWLASRFRHRVRVPFELIGGCMLMLIGVWILLAHLLNGT